MISRPNVVVCICDQLRAFEVGCYGNPVIRTPNVDRLAQEGLRFEHAVTNNPVCMPARSCLMSGQYSRTCQGYLGNYAETDAKGNRTLPEYPAQQRTQLLGRTLPEHFQQAGYETALIGKWHLQPAPHLLGFDYALFPRVHHRHTGQTYIENTGLGERVEGYSVEFEAERVAKFLRARHDRPFFLFYSISPPHMPLDDAPEKYLTMYSPDEVPIRPNVYVDGKLAYDEHWFKIYLWDFLYYQEHLPHTHQLPESFDIRHLIALYYGMTTWMDDMIGRLMAELHRSGLTENTIVVFLSDHGDNLGSHHRFNKETLMEESIRIPLVFHAPHLWSTGVNRNAVAQIVDVLPTLLDWCNMGIPPKVQGQSLRRAMMDPEAAEHSGMAYIETSGGQIGVRTPTHLYGMQLSTDLRTIDEKPRLFFDLRNDPYELTNLAETGAQADLATHLRERLIDWNAHTPWMKEANGL